MASSSALNTLIDLANKDSDAAAKQLGAEASEMSAQVTAVATAPENLTSPGTALGTAVALAWEMEAAYSAGVRACISISSVPEKLPTAKAVCALPRRF